MTQPQEQEIDLSILWLHLRRALPWILSVSLALGALTYFVSRAQPKLYEAQATLLVTGRAAQSNDNVLGEALVTAPPLPEGAVAQALQSPAVVDSLTKNIQADKAFSPEEKARLSENLMEELAKQQPKTLRLTSRLDMYGNGIYTVSGRARTAEEAQALTNLSMNALLEWDKNRALSSVRQAQAGFEGQLKQIGAELDSNKSLSASERAVLETRQAALQESLTRVGILEQSTSGVLQPLAEATVPLEKVAPRPGRNAVLVTLLSLMIGSGLTMLQATTDRRVRSEDDLLELGLPTLANLPRLRQRDILTGGMVKAARQAGLYEAMGFLRVNLLGQLHGLQHPIVMVTSSAPGEGKSSVTAMLADTLGAAGQRVLLIDADLRRGTQEQVWRKFAGNAGGHWVNLSGTGGAQTTPEALQNPQQVQVIEVEHNVHILPAGNGIHDSLAALQPGQLSQALQLWRQNYDLVLIDSAPLLALADGLVLGQTADAVLVVTEAGRTDMRAVRQAIRRAERANLKLVGFVINKQNVREEAGYSYSYSYSYAPKAAKGKRA